MSRFAFRRAQSTDVLVGVLHIRDFSSRRVSFPLKSQRIVAGDSYKVFRIQPHDFNFICQIFAFNRFGDSFQASETIPVQDKAVPIAKAELLLQTNDENISENIVSQTITFRRPLDEFPGTPEDVVGYVLFLTDSRLNIKAQLQNKTVFELGQSDVSGDMTSIGFHVLDLHIRPGDFYLIVAFNNDGLAFPKDYAYLAIVDFSAPVFFAVPTSLTVSQDTNLLFNIVTQVVSFVRVTKAEEERASPATIIGYALFLVFGNGTMRELEVSYLFSI